MKTALKIILATLLVSAGVLQADTLRVVFSYSITPDSLVSLRVGGYGGYGGAETSLQVRVVFSYQLIPDSLVALRVGGFGGYDGVETDGIFHQRIVASFSLFPDSLVALRVGGFDFSDGVNVDIEKSGRYVISYSITPDSLMALRVGGYGFSAASDVDHSARKRLVASFSITPDSLIALRVGGWRFSPGISVDDSAQKRIVFSFDITPDSLVALRVAGFGTDTGALDHHPRTRWVFSYAWAGSILVVIRSTPPGAVLSIDTLTFTSDTTLVWLFPESHSISADTLQRVLGGSYWYHFKFWLTAGGDTLWNPDTLIFVSCSDTFTAYFSYEPTPKVLLKDGIWFDPYGEKRSFINPLSPVEP